MTIDLLAVFPALRLHFFAQGEVNYFSFGGIEHVVIGYSIIVIQVRALCTSVKTEDKG